jgi:hypothetical protein
MGTTMKGSVSARLVGVAALFATTSFVAMGGGIAHAAPPANDNFADRTVIATHTSVAFDTTEATMEDPLDFDATLAACGLDLRGLGIVLQTVWFDFTPTVTETLAVTTNSAVGGWAIVTGDPGAFVGTGCSFVNNGHVDVQAGVTYHLAIADLAGAGHPGTFSLDTPPPPPPPPALTIDPSGSVDNHTGQAVITGTITCAPDFGGNFSIQASAVQRQGRFLLTSFFGAGGTCTGAPQPWSANSAAFNGLLRSGPINLTTIDSTACNSGGCSGAIVPDTTVILKGANLPTPPPPPPPPSSIVGTVDPTASLDLATNTATLTGSVTCTGGGTAQLFGVVRQVSQRMFVDGFIIAELGVCDGTTQRWSAQFTATTGILTGGTASLVDMNFLACDPFFGCVGGAITGTVQLTSHGHRPGFGAPPPRFVDPRIAVNLDKRMVLDRATNTVTISGAVACNGLSGVVLLSDVTQLVGRIYITARADTFTATPIVCDGVPHRLSLPAQSFDGILVNGRAVVTAQAGGCVDSGLECAATEATANVRLVSSRRG